jgi:hypothetical protein
LTEGRFFLLFLPFSREKSTEKEAYLVDWVGHLERRLRSQVLEDPRYRWTVDVSESSKVDWVEVM